MFEHLFSQSSVVARHRAAPYAEERAHYLTHCAQQGYARATLRLKARELLWVARKLQVHPELPVTPAQLEAAASAWEGRQQDAGRPLNIRRTQARFMAEARAWLRFLGCWYESPETVPFAALREEFASWMASARGLSAVTIQSSVGRVTSTNFCAGMAPGDRPWPRCNSKISTPFSSRVVTKAGLACR